MREQRFEVLIHPDGGAHLRILGLDPLSCIGEKNKLLALLAQNGVDVSTGSDGSRSMELGQVMCG